MKKIFLYFMFAGMIQASTPQSDELVVLHNVTTAQMNAIVSPQSGSLVFNSDNNEVYEYDGTTWKQISNNGSETKIIAGDGLRITGAGTAENPYVIDIVTPYDCTSDATLFTSCRSVTSSTNGVYCIDPDGNGGISPYEVYCDMTTDNGGWSRVIRTTGNNHHFGQQDDAINYATTTKEAGVYLAYKNIRNFSKIMIKKVGTSDFASYDLVNSINGESIEDLMRFAKNQTMHIKDDSAFDGIRVKGLTSEYSGIKVAGTLNYNYFFMAGINESRDNDQSYITFSDATGSSNSWGDRWRGPNQIGTLWSFLNGDYYTSTNYHIGNGYSQAGAGYKGENNGIYEIYIK